MTDSSTYTSKLQIGKLAVIRTSSKLVYRSMPVLTVGHASSVKLSCSFLYRALSLAPLNRGLVVMSLPKYGSAHVWEIICVTGWAKPGGIEELVPHQVCSTLDRQCPGLGRLKSHYWTDWHLWICTVLCTINQQPGGPYGELVT